MNRSFCIEYKYWIQLNLVPASAFRPSTLLGLWRLLMYCGFAVSLNTMTIIMTTIALWWRC